MIFNCLRFVSGGGTARCVGLLLVLLPFQLFAIQEVAVDVCVYGGTSGGVIAAAQAARMGKSVALVVVNNHLGGMTSGGLGQTDIGGFGTDYIQGLAGEFYTRIGAKYGTGAKFTFEPHVAEAVFAEMAQQAGMTVYTNQYLTAITKQGERIIAATMDNGNIFRAKIFIDASYEGDLMAAAGVSYTVGRESTSQYGESLNGVRPPNAGGHQFGSLKIDPYLMSANPASGLMPLIQTNAPGTPGAADKSVQAYNFRMCLTSATTNQLPITAPPNYNPAQYELLARYIQAKIDNGSSPSLATFMNIGSMPNNKTDINNNGAVSTDFIGNSAAYVEANYATRQQIWQAHQDYLQGFFYFLGHDSRVPSNVRNAMLSYGFCKDEFVDNGGWPHQLYVREARRMISDYVMTQSNCLGLVTVADPVGMAAYVMDSHNCQRVVANGLVQNEGDTYGLISIPGTYSISYRSIVPKARECSNLLVPWCLSASHMAFGSIRMEPVFMILSQSAATAACLAIDDKVSVQDVNYSKLRSQLTADKQELGMAHDSNQTGAIIVDNADVNGVSVVGAWISSSASSGYYNEGYLHDGSNNKGQSSVTFTPTLPQSGKYHVYARWTTNANRSASVPIDVVSPSGTQTVLVDQTKSNGVWVLLSTTNFNAGTTGYVRIRNAGTTGYVIADAVEFINASNLPVVKLWASDATISRYGLQTGSFAVSRSSNTNVPLTVYLNIGGTASNGVDCLYLPNTVDIPTGQAFTRISIAPYNSMPVGDKTLIVSLASNSNYTIGDLNTAIFNIDDVSINAWRVRYFGTNANNPAIAGDSANPAGDGLANLVKYAFGKNPTQVTTGLPVDCFISADDSFGLSYTRPDPPPTDVAYWVETSDDLKNWCTNLCAVTKTINFNSDNTATIISASPVPVSGLPKQFMRLRVDGKGPFIQGAKVVAFGDSITYAYGVPTASNWCNQLQARFNLIMVNAGVSGNTSSQGLARIQNDVLDQHPGFVIINFGMNDHVMTALDTPKVSQAAFRSNLRAMIDRVRTNNAIPILVTANYIIEGDATQYYYNRHPASYYANVGGAQAWLDSYLQIVRDVAAEKHVDMADVREACNSYNQYEFLRSLANGANEDDGVHPYFLGSVVYARVIGDYLAARY